MRGCSYIYFYIRVANFNGLFVYFFCVPVRVFYKMLYDTNGKQLPHQQHSVGGGSKRSGGLIKQLSGAASGSQNPQQQNRLRMLLKRSSEPLLIFQHNQHSQQYQSRVRACFLRNFLFFFKFYLKCYDE